MNKHILIISIVIFACSGVMRANEDKARTLQESLHIWIPEPELTTAIVCSENDFGCEHPNEPDKHKEVPLPAPVRDAIYTLTKEIFENQLYDDPTKYEDLFGYIYRLTIPDSNNLHLYVYQMKPIPWLSSRYYSIILILYDNISDTISSSHIHLYTDFQSYCFRPWISFQDVLGDSKKEILILTGEHNGSDFNCMHQNIIQIESDKNLVKLGRIRTGVTDYFPDLGQTWKDRHGYIGRTIEKVDPNHFSVIVSYSIDKQPKGDRILGDEIYELQENNVLKRITLNLRGNNEDQKAVYKKILTFVSYF